MTKQDNSELDELLNAEYFTEEEKLDAILLKLEFGEKGSPSHLQSRALLAALLSNTRKAAIDEFEDWIDRIKLTEENIRQVIKELRS